MIIEVFSFVRILKFSEVTRLTALISLASYYNNSMVDFYNSNI